MSTPITKEQCKAARSFLGIKQTELAQDCGLSKTAITHFESGLYKPRADNMTKIRNALERRGIEFIGDYGVQKRQVYFNILDKTTDKTALPKLWDDIFETLKATNEKEVLISFLDERLSYKEHPEALSSHLKRLKDHNITERLLVCENDTFFIQDDDCYRWLPSPIYKTGMTTFLYGGRLALQFWNGSFILIIEHPEIYKEEKQRFEYLWDNALIPSINKTSENL